MTQDTQTTVTRDFERLHAQDFEGLRALMHDDLAFVGPIDTFDRPEPLIEALERSQAIPMGVAMRRIFVDGEDACALYDLVTDTPIGTSPMAEWFEVRDGRIARIQVYYDAAPIAALLA